MIQYFVPLFGSFLTTDFWLFYFIPILCLGIVSIIPCIIRSIIRGW